MFRTKICGVTSVDQAELVVASGVDAVGLNFYSKSKRYLTSEIASEVRAAVPDSVRAVGLFVNASRDAVLGAHDKLQLDFIQLHGDEDVEFVRNLGDVPVIKAVRVQPDEPPLALRQFAELKNVKAILLDAYQPGQYGGTGVALDWNAVPAIVASLPLPVVLAGGLTAENVAQAIASSAAFAVDTASGVESAPGIKAADLCREFVQAANLAFSQQP